MGGMSLGGQLKRLEEDYNLVKKKRPILSKEGSQTVRYEVSDMFYVSGSGILSSIKII